MDTATKTQAASNPADERIVSDMKLFKGFKSKTPAIAGRRAFCLYRDLGVQLASNNRMRAVKSDPIPARIESTQWHYHVCDFNFVYFLKGTVTFELEDGTISTFSEGESIFIPGGFRHNEVYMSPDLEAIEFSMPGEIGTVLVDRPAHLPPVLKRVDSANPD